MPKQKKLGNKIPLDCPFKGENVTRFVFSRRSVYEIFHLTKTKTILQLVNGKACLRIILESLVGGRGGQAPLASHYYTR